MRKWFLRACVVTFVTFLALKKSDYVYIQASLWDPSVSDNSSCRSETPIKVAVFNLSLNRVKNVRISMEAWRNGRGQNVLEGPKLRNFNLVLPPLSGRTGCFDDQLFERWRQEAKQMRPAAKSDNLMASSVGWVKLWMDAYAKFQAESELSVVVEAVEIR